MAPPLLRARLYMDASKAAVLAVVIVLALILARSDDARAFAFRHHDPAAGPPAKHARTSQVRCEQLAVADPARQP